MTTRGILMAAMLAALAAGATWLVTARRPGVDVPAAHRRLYQCSMHPQIVSEEPGTCPICGMRLTAVEPSHGVAGEPATRTPLFYRHPMRPDVTSPTPAKDEMGMDYVPVYPEDRAATETAVPGHAAFALSAERQQLIGVRRGHVEEKELATTIRAVGRVAYDPELYQAIVDYREALAARKGLGGSTWAEARTGADALVRAATLRLRQRGIPEEQLAAMARGGDPVNLLLPGKTVWIYAQVYEYEVDLVQPGQEMIVTAAALPGRSFTSRVVAVDPILDARTRTARVRALLATPEASLRPETFTSVEIRVPLGRRLAVPKEAIFDTGAHRIAFVVREGGRFEPRSVDLGREAGDDWEVLGGLAPGDEVVTSANFLIDSESRFRAALADFTRQPDVPR